MYRHCISGIAFDQFKSPTTSLPLGNGVPPSLATELVLALSTVSTVPVLMECSRHDNRHNELLPTSVL